MLTPFLAKVSPILLFRGPPANNLKRNELGNLQEVIRSTYNGIDASKLFNSLFVRCPALQDVSDQWLGDVERVSLTSQKDGTTSKISARNAADASRTRWGEGTIGGSVGGKTPITIPLTVWMCSTWLRYQ